MKLSWENFNQYVIFWTFLKHRQQKKNKRTDIWTSGWDACLPCWSARVQFLTLAPHSNFLPMCWVPITYLGNANEFLAPVFSLAQPWLLQPFREWTSGWMLFGLSNTIKINTNLKKKKLARVWRGCLDIRQECKCSATSTEVLQTTINRSVTWPSFSILEINDKIKFIILFNFRTIFL